LARKGKPILRQVAIVRVSQIAGEDTTASLWGDGLLLQVDEDSVGGAIPSKAFEPTYG